MGAGSWWGKLWRSGRGNAVRAGIRKRKVGGRGRSRGEMVGGCRRGGFMVRSSTLSFPQGLLVIRRYFNDLFSMSSQFF